MAMKILIACTNLAGHLNPMLSIGQLLIEEGHEVVVQTASIVRDRVESIGATFRAFPAEFDYDMRDLDGRFPERKMLPPPERVTFDIKRIFTDPIPAMHNGLQQVLQEFSADVVLADPTFFGIYPMLLGPRSKRPAVIVCGITFLLWHRDDAAPAILGLPPARNAAEREQYAAIAKDFDANFEPVVRYLNDCLAGLGVGPIPTGFFDTMVVLADAFLELTAPGFEFPRSDLPRTVQFVGGLPITPDQAPRPAWAGDLDGSRKVVLVTQGTVSNHDLGELIAPTLAALADEQDLLVVASAGGRSIDAIPGPIPANARLASYLPMEWLLPKVDVLVTNGGYGTVNQALAFGIPIVAAGQTEDKAGVSARIEWSGVGIDLKVNQPTPAAVREAVRSLLDESHYRARASSMAREFARTDTRARILQAVERLGRAPAKAVA
jgi:MGT family glycosyltransferase